MCAATQAQVSMGNVMPSLKLWLNRIITKVYATVHTQICSMLVMVCLVMHVIMSCYMII